MSISRATRRAFATSVAFALIAGQLLAQDVPLNALDPTDFFSVAPCRVLDTRSPDGPLGGPALVAGADRAFPLSGVCGIPPDATAVSVNIAVTGATAASNLRLHAGGTAVPLVSTINYSAGQTRSNNAVVALSPTGELAAFVGGAAGSVHLILDVNGYFAPAPPPVASTVTLALTSGTNPSTFGDPLTFTATVTGGAGTPTGTVTFMDGASPIGAPVALSGGSASILISTLSVGSHSLTAAYNGDSAYLPSTSTPAVTQTVNPATPPAVVATAPADGATGVPVLSTIAVAFNAAMNPATLTAQTTAGACLGSIRVSTDDFATCISFASSAPVMSNGNSVATLTPAPALSYGSIYTVRVTTAAQGAAGMPLGATYTSGTGFTTTAAPVSCNGSVVISQVYGGGGNTGAPFQNDYIEIHNRGTATVSLAGWSVQYASAGGVFGTASTNLSGSIGPGQYLLIQEAAGAMPSSPLPTPDFAGNIAISSSAGKVALSSSTIALVGACPTGGSVVDFVGYGAGTTCFEGSGPTPAPSNTTSVLRAGAGCTDAGSNDTDFVTGAPNPRNGAAAASVCSCGGGTVNETGLAAEADFCNLQFPSTISVQGGTPLPQVYGRLFEAGVTEPAGPNPAVRAQFGYGPPSANPESQAGWTFVPAAFGAQVGNDDEYQSSPAAPSAPGTYTYTYRFSLDGLAWTYCDLDGAGANAGLAFETTQLGTMTVTP